MDARTLLTLLWMSVLGLATDASQTNLLNAINGIIQNPVVSCQNEKKKILCLPLDYSKFDLPYRNDFNEIDIGKLCIFKTHFYRRKMLLLPKKNPISHIK